MFLQPLSIEFTLERPDASLGDALTSPLFHRVSTRCPVLHVFGVVQIPRVASLSRGCGGTVAAAPLSYRASCAVHGSGQAEPSVVTPPQGRGSVAAVTSAHQTTGSATSPAPRPPAGAGARDAGVAQPESTAHHRHAVSPFGLATGATASYSIDGVDMVQHHACVHVHGVYPYFLVPQYDASVSATQFGAQLETVAAQVLSRDPAMAARAGLRPGRGEAQPQLLHDVELVSRVPFYGWHRHARFFFKISLINPSHAPVMVRLLQDTTAVGGRSWQPYDAHSPYHSQFMIDYDVKGITPVRLSRCHARAPLPPELHGVPLERLRADWGIIDLRPADDTPRQTEAEAELDVRAADLRDPATAGEPGANFAHVRRMIRRYFAEHRVPDALRVANTIATELRDHEAWRRGESNARAPDVLRYVTVAQLQRMDPAAVAMRQQMLHVLAVRQSSDAARHEGDDGSAVVEPPKRKAESIGANSGSVSPPVIKKSCSTAAVSQATHAGTKDRGAPSPVVEQRGCSSLLLGERTSSGDVLLTSDLLDALAASPPNAAAAPSIRFWSDSGEELHTPTQARASAAIGPARLTSQAGPPETQVLFASVERRATAGSTSSAAAVPLLSSSSTDSLRHTPPTEVLTPQVRYSAVENCSCSCSDKRSTRRGGSEVRSRSEETPLLSLSDSSSSVSSGHCGSYFGFRAGDAVAFACTTRPLSSADVAESSRGADEPTARDLLPQQPPPPQQPQPRQLQQPHQEKREWGGGPFVLYAARITSFTAHHVRLRWYVRLRETHFAVDEVTLLRQRAWLPPGPLGDVGVDSGQATPLLAGEYFLSEVEEESPLQVLQAMCVTDQATALCLTPRPLQVCGSLDAYRAAAVATVGGNTAAVALCRYEYHMETQLLVPIEDGSTDVGLTPSRVLVAQPRALQTREEERDEGGDAAGWWTQPILAAVSTAASSRSPPPQEHLHLQQLPDGSDAETTRLLSGSTSSSTSDASLASSDLLALHDTSRPDSRAGSEDICASGERERRYGDLHGLDEAVAAASRLCARLPLRRTVGRWLEEAHEHLTQKRSFADFSVVTTPPSQRPAGDRHASQNDGCTVTEARSCGPRRYESVDVKTASSAPQEDAVVVLTSADAYASLSSTSSASVEAVDARHLHFAQACSHFPQLMTSHSRAGACTGALAQNFRLCCAPRTCSNSGRDPPVVHISAATWPMVSGCAGWLPLGGSLWCPPGDFAEAATSSRRRLLCAAPTAAQPQTEDITPPQREGLSKRRVVPPGVGGALRAGTASQRPSRACVLRVLYVEVILSRDKDIRDIEKEELLAVGLGRAASTGETVAVQLFCVSSPSRRPRPDGGRWGLTEQIEVVELPSERDLLLRVYHEIRRCNPDALLSWEGFKYGIGLLALRYRAVLQRSLAADLSRLRAPWCESAAAVAEETRTASAGAPLRDVALPPHAEAAVDEGSNGMTCLHATPDSTSPASSSDGSQPPPPPQLRQRTSGGAGGGPVDAAAVAQKYARRFGANVRITGRICSSLSKDLRKVIKLPSHALPMVHQVLLGQSLPYFTDLCLSQMYHDEGGPARGGGRRTALDYLATRVVAPHRIARHTKYFARLVEFSQLYGVLLEEVLTRGSQYRVEASLLRMAHPQQYATLTPSAAQVARQPRIRTIPLVMQPRSLFYKDDPVVVLDFRSLYPSVIIAYNLCYSTCLGVVSSAARGRLGVQTAYEQDDQALAELLPDDGLRPDLAIFAPSGAVFAPPSARAGVLPQMVETVLDTRFEVQAALKHVAQPSGDAYEQQVLSERQLALKMLANVTYGYTAASFTGRMPCVDLAEAIVSLGRRTLERAIALIGSTSEWGAEVVYGDTDSVFVRLRGRTLPEAFDIGEAIAAAVTAANPSPIRLQFEKVLLPCLLLVKKRYVGYAWYDRAQQQPEFLAKGVETVRRDQCPATARIARELVEQLFLGADEARLKAHYYAAVSAVQRGDGDPFDFIFRRAVKLGRGYSDAHLPLGARVALKMMEADIAQTPFWGERLPYVVVRSLTSVRLRDQVIHPQQMLCTDDTTALDAEYYIRRHINPVLDRMFYLVGVSFAHWYELMPRRRACHAPLRPDEFNTWWHTLQRQQPQLPASPRKRDRAEDAASAVIELDASVSAESLEPTPQARAVGGEHVQQQAGDPLRAQRQPRRRTLDAYYPSTMCLVCREQRAALTKPVSAESPEAAPPICTTCWRDPQLLYCRVMERAREVARRLQEVEQACLLCIGGGGLVGGPSWLASTARSRRVATPSSADLPDVEDYLPPVCVPRRLACAVSSSGVPDNEGGNPHGCLSIDCTLAFEKKRVTLLDRQLRALVWYLNRALSC